MMWIIILVLVLIAAIGGLIYLIRGFRRFSFIKELGNRSIPLSWAVTLLPFAGIACFAFINVWSVMIVLIHLFFFWLAADLIGKLIRRCLKKERRRNIEGCIAIVFTAAYLGIGWYMAHHVFRTEYSFTTSKNIGGDSLRIVEIADLHLGITLDGDQFEEQCRRIDSESPDVVIVAGDFVDDESEKDDMITACSALGNIDTDYGVYFIFGNHDKGYYNSRDFSADDLRAELEKNGVIILEDECVLVNDSFYIIGRQDKSEDERAPMSELIKDTDDSKYVIVADHQPNDYANEADAGADLVLSGHTHGGHVFPAGQIGLLIGANDRIYGTETRGSTDFVVTSGISGWAIPFKTGTFSEYVVIDIKKE